MAERKHSDANHIVVLTAITIIIHFALICQAVLKGFCAVNL